MEKDCEISSKRNCRIDVICPYIHRMRGCVGAEGVDGGRIIQSVVAADTNTDTGANKKRLGNIGKIFSVWHKKIIPCIPEETLTEPPF